VVIKKYFSLLLVSPNQKHIPKILQEQMIRVNSDN
jgi:hypothetical protein